MASTGIVAGTVNGTNVVLTPYLSQQPVDDFSLRFAGLQYSATLAVNTDTLLTIPDISRRYKAVLKCAPASMVWVAINQVATVPVGASFAVTSSELIPQNGLCREVVAGDIIHFISAAASQVSVVLYYVIS